MQRGRFRASSWALALASVTGIAVIVVAGMLDVHAASTEGSQQRLAARLEALVTAEQRVETLLLNVEVGQRGYLLTSRAEFLEPYQTAVRTLPGQLDAVDELAGAEPSAASEARQIRQLATAKVDNAAQTIRVHDDQGAPAASALVASGHGKAIMDQLRATVSDTSAASRSELGSRVERARSTGARSDAVRTAAAALLLALLGTMLWLVQQRERGESQRLEAERTREALVTQLARQSVHDALTGQPNRRLLEDRLTQALGRSARDGTLLAVLFIDLDHFKDINDRYGHAVGDQVLVTTARRIGAVLRGTDTLARVGGDEFVVLCEQLQGEAAALALASVVQDRLADPLDVEGMQVDVSASIGVVVADSTGIRLAESDGDLAEGPPSIDALMSAADEAMYCAKNLGRARHHRYGAEVARSRQARVTLLSDLREALTGDEAIGGRLWVAYQPLVDLATGETVGVEALCRWTHPALGEVGPATFIPIAEAAGLISTLGEVVLTTACAQLVSWNDSRAAAGLPRLYVSVNCSARQLLHPSYTGRLAQILADVGADPSTVMVELTESVLVDSVTGAAARLQSLADLGVRLALDDFGTGYSSLAYLRRFPFDVIKIDQSFVAGLGQDVQDEAIVTSVVAMAGALDRTLIIEGIETAAQAAHAQRLGCRFAQGYHFGRPSSAEQLGPRLVPPIVRHDAARAKAPHPA
jgi:diguanylate cyclase (GGDEF)-like protein